MSFRDNKIQISELNSFFGLRSKTPQIQCKKNLLTTFMDYKSEDKMKNNEIPLKENASAIEKILSYPQIDNENPSKKEPKNNLKNNEKDEPKEDKVIEEVRFTINDTTIAISKKVAPSIIKVNFSFFILEIHLNA